MWVEFFPKSSAHVHNRRITMNDKLIELLLKIESLNTEDLEKVSAWIEFNLNKRKSEDCELPNCFTQIHTY